MYSSPECCLCDDALKVFESIGAGVKWGIEKKNIYTDKGLLIKYRYTIPVLHILGTDAELNWPFDELILSQWLESQK